MLMIAKTIGAAAMLAAMSVPLAAQDPAPPASPEPALLTARMANRTMPMWLTKAAEAMSEQDYAYRPTPDVRTFGQIMAHVADQDYLFCAGAKGEKPLVQGLEKTLTSKADIRKALAGAIAYCNDVYAGMTDASARTMVSFGTAQMPSVSLLLFRTNHQSLHYGNVVTYMRLRGKVPPSTGG